MVAAFRRARLAYSTAEHVAALIEMERVITEGSRARPGSFAALRARVTGLSYYSRGLIALTAAALASRVILLGSVPRFWGDEAFNGVQLRKPLGSMLDVVRHDSHPPLLYLLERMVAVISTSPAALRLVSALAGTAAVLLAAALGRRIAGDRGGLLAAAVLAAFPTYLQSSRDARGYSLAMALILAAALTLWRAIERPTPWRLAAYGLCAAAAMYTHYFAIPAIGGQLLVALLVFRPRRRVALLIVGVGAAAGLSLVPWLIAAMAQFQHVGAPFWVATIHPGSLFADTARGLSQTPAQELTAVGAWLAEAAVIPLLVIAYRLAGDGSRRGTLYLLGCALAPTLALLVVSLWKPVYDARFIAMFWGPGEAVVGASLVALRWRLAPVAICLALAAASLVSLLQIQRPDFNAVASPLNGHVGDGDVVALNGPDHYFSVAYAGDAATNRALRVVSENVPWYFGTAGYPPGTEIGAVPDVRGRIYVVGDATQNQPTLPPGFHHVQRACHDAVCVDTYSR
jgi:4-amino-4-deoxy-L-arabinose transferase-like glycosyltransferase